MHDLEAGKAIPIKMTSSFLSPVAERFICISSSCLDKIFAILIAYSFTFDDKSFSAKLKNSKP